jgi:hypothetical protein
MAQMVGDDDPDNHKATKEPAPSLLCQELPLCIENFCNTYPDSSYAAL